MAQQRTAPQSTPTEPLPPPNKRDLTVNKVLAGAGAAATSAVLGSYFGAVGTVAGAALGSVASTLTTSLYQHTLDRSRERIVARIRVSERPTTILPAPRDPASEETVRLHVEPDVRPRMSRRRIAIYAGATVLVFVLGLLAVTGLEWVKGSSLTTGQQGTSVGRVIKGDPPAAPVEDTSEDEEQATETPSSTATPSSTRDADADAEKKATTSAKPTDDEPKGGVRTPAVPTPSKKASG